MPEEFADAPTILLVEDNMDDERLALRTLRHHAPSAQVRVARDGYEALLFLGIEGDQSIGHPDLVLCDMKLPKVTGDEVLRCAHADERLRKVPFVMFSSSDMPEEAERCHSLGAAEHVVKPVGFEEYRACLKAIVERYLDPASCSI